MKINDMTPKEEFYDIISKRFNSDEIQNIREICDSLENESKVNNVDSLYLQACSLYFVTARDYNNFITNLKSRSFYTPKSFEIFMERMDKTENIMKDIYDYCIYDIDNVINNYDFFRACSETELYELKHSIANAIVPELYNWIEINDKICKAEDLENLKLLNEKLSQGNNTLTDIKFYVDNNIFMNLHSHLYNSAFWMDFYEFSYHRLYVPSYNEFDSKTLNDIKVNIGKHIVIKIGMIFIKYGLIKEALNPNNYILKTENGSYVSIANKVCLNIYRIVDEISKRKMYRNVTNPPMTGFFKLREDRKGSKTYNDIKEDSDRIQIIKSLLKTGKKINDSFFTFSDISSMEYACIFSFPKTTKRTK